MKTLYLRNVPIAVVDRLKRLAEADGMSMNAVAVRELATISRRVDNPSLLAALPDHGLNTSTIIEDLDVKRGS